MYFAPASRLSPYSVYCTRRTLCAQFKTNSWYADHPFFLFHTDLSFSLFLLKAPTYVHDHLLGRTESSNRVRARVPEGIKLDKPGWIPLNFPHTSVPLPGIYQAPGGFYCPINFSSWILLGLFPTISFNYKMRDIFTHTHLLLYQSRLANSKRHGKESEPVGKHILGTAERRRCDGSGVCCSC